MAFEKSRNTYLRKKKRVQRILASRGIIKDTAMYEKVIILSFASSNPRAVFAIKTDV